MFDFRSRLARASLVLGLLVLLAMLLIPASTAFAANVPGTGQPNQSCEDVGVRPGSAMNAPGSAFNPTGVAGAVYAGTQPQVNTSPKAVSQYDVACFQVSQH